MNILLVLLGSHVSYLLNDRIHTATTFVKGLNDANVDWFLSGGIKNPGEDIVSEAEKMEHHLSGLTNNNWNYIIDTKSTNTAENFIAVQKYLSSVNKVYNNVYIITSKFHYTRASRIAEQILSVEPQWILGDAKLEDSDYWERIHIKNVDSDVSKAFKKFSNDILKYS